MFSDTAQKARRELLGSAGVFGEYSEMSVLSMFRLRSAKTRSVIVKQQMRECGKSGAHRLLMVFCTCHTVKTRIFESYLVNGIVRGKRAYQLMLIATGRDLFDRNQAK